MKNTTQAIIVALLFIGAINAAIAAREVNIKSPNKKVSVLVNVSPEGKLSYSVKADNKQIWKQMDKW